MDFIFTTIGIILCLVVCIGILLARSGLMSVTIENTEKKTSKTYGSVAGDKKK